MATDDCTPDNQISLTQSLAPGTRLGTGITNITLTATDLAGNTSSCAKPLHVYDGTGPALSCPSTHTINITANNCIATMPDLVALSTISDNCFPRESIITSQSIPIGTTLSLGNYSVRIEARDPNPQFSYCTVNVSVIQDNSVPNSDVLFVKANSTATNPDGTSWNNAFKTIQDAMQKLNTCSNVRQIWVAEGTYYPDGLAGAGSDSRDASFTMRNNLAILGGFPNTGNPGLGSRNPGSYETILSGDIQQDGISSNNAYHVVFNNNNGLNASAVIDGFTITGGTASGGGMYNASSSPSVYNCSFENNTGGNGGAMYNYNSTAGVVGCTFMNNTADYGGAMYNDNASTTLSRCNFISNSASSRGGAIYYAVLTRAAVIDWSRFKGNSSPIGGAIAAGNASVLITNCEFIGNTGSGSALNQVGTSSNFANTLVTNSSFSGNAGGATIYDFGGYPIITNCIIWGNSSGVVNIFGAQDLYVTYSIVQGGYSGTGNKGVDPLFISQPTIGLGTSGDLRLKSCSPAIDMGNNTACINQVFNCPTIGGVATDLGGNSRRYNNGTVDMGAYEVQSAFVSCNEPPVAVCQSLTVVSDGGCYNSAIVDSDFDGGSTDPEAGRLDLSVSPVGPYPVGTTNVVLTVRDPEGASSTCAATIKVLDNEAPSISCAGPKIQTADAGQCGAVVTVATPTTGDNCGVASVLNNFNNGADASDTYPVGTTTVIWTVTDIHGKTNTCSQTITVTDNEKPSISCAGAKSQTADAGQCNAAVTLAPPTTGDNCGVASVINNYNNGADASDTYPVGTTTVIWTATDIHGKTNTCSQNITVTDNEKPSISCAGAKSQTADAGQCNAAVTLAPPTTGDNCGVASVVNNYNGTGNASGTYPVGTTTVIWTVTDIHGKTNTCSQNITVTDNEKPVFTTCPTDLILTLPNNQCETVVNYATPAGKDNCGVRSLQQTAGRLSGDVYPMGPSTQSFLLTDIHGNTAVCAFTITVDGNQKDSDRDGVSNACDICPGADDLLDTDGDGLPDCIDPCPTNRDNTDTDGDGIGDGCDNCPSVPNMAQSDTDGDGIGNECDICQGSDDTVDSDTDGVPDGCDQCPGHPDDVDANNNGIPDGCDFCQGTDLSADAGNCDVVFAGYQPEACTTLTVSVAGGSAPYAYQWSNGQTSATITVCPTRTTTYSVTVTDDKECKAMDMVTVEAVDVSCGKNKVALCLNGQALCVPVNKVQENLDQGATLGACGLVSCGGSGLSLAALPSSSIANRATNAMDFRLYPNPTRKQINVGLEDFVGQAVQLVIYNQLGQIVRTIRIDEVQVPVEPIDLDRLGYGTYLMQLRTKEQVLVKKFVILE